MWNAPVKHHHPLDDVSLHDHPEFTKLTPPASAMADVEIARRAYYDALREVSNATGGGVWSSTRSDLPALEAKLITLGDAVRAANEKSGALTAAWTKAEDLARSDIAWFERERSRRWPDRIDALMDKCRKLLSPSPPAPQPDYWMLWHEYVKGRAATPQGRDEKVLGEGRV
jgi:hypothetical protein